VRRRDLAWLLAVGCAVPSVAWAQPAPTVGYLGSGAPGDAEDSLPGLYQGLEEAGFVAGRNVDMLHLWGEGNDDRLPALAAELVSRGVAVILCSALPATVAAKQATTTIPIVFVSGADPVRQGIVESLARPGGNLTGVTQLYGALGGKRLELLREIVPGMRTVAVLSNPLNPNARNHLNDVEAAARTMGIGTAVLNADAPAQIDVAFARLAELEVGGALIADDPMFRGRRSQITALAVRHTVLAIHFGRDFVLAGGLLSYGSSARENMRLAGGYVGRILKGAKPAGLPVLQPTSFELVINLKAAKVLGLSVPLALLARADEVIE
jgi:putative tryptophan/tyrosine transport system substrate-binding protein